MMDLECAASGQGSDDGDSIVTLIIGSPPRPINIKHCLSTNGLMENQVASMANIDHMPTFSSPAEASLAKPIVALPNTTNDIMKKSPTTSDITSASDSLTSTGTSFVEMTTESLCPPLAPSAEAASSVDSVVREKVVPAVLNFKGISVTLENHSVWKQFHSYGTEMILTKQGRRMFPYCRYRLAGLNPTQRYSLVLSIVPADHHKYRWNVSKWEVSGQAEHQSQGIIRAFSHHNSPCLGSEWMNTLVSFYKLKLTNNGSNQEGHIILHSMHRYIPRLHVIPVLDGDGPTPDQPVIKGPESMTFTFPQTEFLSVTTYQNPWIVQLKINHNPFAKGFRDELNPRLSGGKSDDAEGREDGQSAGSKPTGSGGASEIGSDKTENPSTKKPISDEPREPEAQVTQPSVEMGPRCEPEASISKEEKEVNCVAKNRTPIQCPKRPRGRPRKHPIQAVSQPGHVPDSKVPDSSALVGAVTPSHLKALTVESEEESGPDTPASSMSTPQSTPGRKKKRINRRWGNSRGREAKVPGAPVSAAASPSLAVTMQPECDDVEGLLFVSFTSKEALGLHVDIKAMEGTGSLSQESSMSLLTPKLESVPTEETPEKVEKEKKCVTQLQALLVEDLRDHRHRQVIHPILREVGLKLSSLDPSKAIDLNYLGVRLPLPPPDLPGQGNTTPLSPTTGGLAFVSRTGKTSDLTKIKGWRDKFIKSKESSPSGSQKDLSAFCSNMLDEYLENEAQRISERAAAFSTSPDCSVAYQLPDKSSSYVKTLDSVLKHRPVPNLQTNKSCPLSHKPLLYSALTAPAHPLASPLTPDQSGSKPKAKPPASAAKPRPKPLAPKPFQEACRSPMSQGGARASADGQSPQGASPTSQRSQSCNSGPSQKQGPSCQGNPHHKTTGLTKLQLKLLDMEEGTVNLGLNRTHLTPDRLSVALSALLTATMLPSQRLPASQFSRAVGPECGQEFCRLGCVCASLNRHNRGPLHCRRPDCMLGCACFKRKIIKEKHVHPVYSVTNLQHEVQPSPGSHCDKMWDKSKALPDPEPLFAPKSVDLSLFSSQHTVKRTFYQQAPPIHEKDKDPVYKYLESLMTCARIREFKPPSQDSHPHKILPHPYPKKPHNPPKKFPNIILTFRNAGNASAQDDSGEPLDSQQIEIQSECHWDNDRKMVLGALCQRIKRKSLSMPFQAGPYHISLISKVLRPKANGFTVAYKMRICKPKASTEDEEEEDEEEEDEEDAEDVDMSSSSETEHEAIMEDRDIEEMPIAVTPFLSGVLPAGRLKARKKPGGSNAVGLIQVNGKSYTQARLMLGNMGSLHPANRVAAYVTGRLRGATKTPQGEPCKTDSSLKGFPHATRVVKRSGHFISPVSARKTDPVQKKSTALREKIHTPLAPQNHKEVTSPHNKATISSSGKPPSLKPPLGEKVLLQPVRPTPEDSGEAGSDAGSTENTERGGTEWVGRGQDWRNGEDEQTGQTEDKQRELDLFSCEGGDDNPTHPSQKPSAIQPFMSFITGLHGSITPSHNSSFASPVSLTVSRSLKTPSFLGDSGTCSFRICPPQSNYASAGADGSLRHPAGVTLPGGFTLIQLPKHGADQAPRLPAGLLKAPSTKVGIQTKKIASMLALPSDDTYTGETLVKRKEAATGASDQSGGSLVEPRTSPELMCNEKMPSDDSDDAQKCKLSKIPESDSDGGSEDDEENSCSSDYDGDDGEEDGDLSDELVDIETVEDLTRTILEMKKANSALSRSTCDSSEDSGSSVESRSKPQIVEEDHDPEKSGQRRRQHKVLERLRRSEQRHLFSKLQKVLCSDPLATKLRLLSLALIEIRTLEETSKCLEEKKRKLGEMQSNYIKRISCLSGKPEDVIRSKLREIYERKRLLIAQRMNNLVFSQIHQPGPQARLISQSTPTVSVVPTPSPIPTPPPQPQRKAYAAIAPANARSPQPQREVPPQPQRGVPPQPQREVPPQGSAGSTSAQAPVNVHHIRINPGKTGVQPHAPGSTPKANALPQAAGVNQKHMTLPLIRTKTGRIILPSSLKPLGQGFYTITVLGPEEETEKSGNLGETSLPAQADVNPSNQETQRPTDQESQQASGDGNNPQETVTGEKRNPSPPPVDKVDKPAPSAGTIKDVNSPLAEIALLNKSISVPSVATPLRSEVARVMGGGENVATTFLSFNPCSRVYSPQTLKQPEEEAKAEPAQGSGVVSSPAVTRRGRGRPRKHPLTSADEVPLKRGRGRPPKSKRLSVAHNTASIAPKGLQRMCLRGNPAQVSMEEAWKGPDEAALYGVSPVRSTCAVGSPVLEQTLGGGGNNKRPLTRAALGKDFPSAKRKSWVDVEKELELE